MLLLVHGGPAAVELPIARPLSATLGRLIHGGTLGPAWGWPFVPTVRLRPATPGTLPLRHSPHENGAV